MAKLWLPDLQSCFDAAYYLNRYPDVSRSGIDPLAHFLLFGARENRQPNPLFDVSYYLSSNPDVVASGTNPFLHFLRFGWKERRRPNPLFDATYYVGHSPAPPPPDRNPFVDYVVRRRHGEKPAAWLPFALPAESYLVATTRIQAPVDIIIPVYSGLEETRTCLESLLSAACRTAYEIVLVNDRIPDPALTRYLREMADAHAWTLLENSENLGFAASVNRGLRLHPDRDVVILNNDTRVANDWLDRLAAAAAGQTGTVTPFSNNASICSYPHSGVPNPLPDGITVDGLDAIFRQVNAGHRVDLPTGVGFCMYIRRDCLNQAGEFRADVFGKGYGEENDFCLRATYKGWRHALAADVFVYHAGETSFGDEAEARRKAGVEIVERLHPDYGPLVAGHIRQDPAKPYRVAVSAWRMGHSGRPVILSITHDLGGGVGQYVRELRQTLAGQAEMLTLTPTASGAVILTDFDVAFDAESDYPALVDLLRRCGVSRLHVQHLAGHTLDIGRLKHDLEVHLDFSVHDYFPICPQVTLTDATGHYCGEPDAAGCNACLTGRPPWPRLDIATWRERYGALVTLADRVIAPSQDAADRIRRYLPEAKLMTAAHPATKPPADILPPGPLTPDSPLVIAVLGAMTPHKGIHRLRSVASGAWRAKLPLRFVLIGYVDKGPAGVEPFSQTGPYNNDQLPHRLRESGAHVVWFPAQWPETFSYTLSACLEMGLPLIAPDLGAFAERVAGRSWTWIIPWDWDTARMLEFFGSVRRDHFVTGAGPPLQPGSSRAATGGFYPAGYLQSGPLAPGLKREDPTPQSKALLH